MTRTPVIPAPARLTPAAGEFRVVSGTAIGLAALYKLDVLHLHLTGDQGRRVEAGRPGPAPIPPHLLQGDIARRPRTRSS